MTQNKHLGVSRLQKAAALSLVSIMAACSSPSAEVVTKTETTPEIVKNSELEFIPLNPARGDAAPQAGVLWGDIRADVPSGVLLKFADGFTSPPHIHNITYRAVVIDGAVHNDDPTAENMWMGPGSFWTQPAGENHITSGQPGASATAFLEIMEGPYLVQPSHQEFDNSERPLNLEADNIVWLDASDVTWVQFDTSTNSTQIAFLWGGTQRGERNGSFVKLLPQSSVILQGGDAWLRAVVTKGNLSYHVKSDISTLETGSYFGSQDGGAHMITCDADEECILYISTEGRYDVSLANFQ